MKSFFTTTAVLLVTSSLFAQSGMEQASGKAQADLEAALKELAQVQSTIVEEKVPLSQEINQLETQVIDIRSSVERLERISAKQSFNLDALKRELKGRQENSNYITNLLTEFVDNFGIRLPISELVLYEDQLTAAQTAPGDVNLNEIEKLQRQLEIVNIALTRLEDSRGGHRYEGVALSPEGEVVKGNFVSVGPLVFFSSADGSLAGVSQRQQNAANAVVVPIPKRNPSGISSLANTGIGSLPFDASLGKALQIAGTRETVSEHIAKGGMVGYATILLGITAFSLAAFKVFEIYSFNAPTSKTLTSILTKIEDGNDEEALKEAKSISGLSGEMLQEGVTNAHEKRGLVEELMFEKILQARPLLERFLPFIAIAAAAAPLMGLLGTVTGMIKTFNLITVFGTGDAKSLSSGISEALVTTELGLIVAIPCLILHGLLSRLARRKLGQMEQVAIAFINGIARRKDKAS